MLYLLILLSPPVQFFAYFSESSLNNKFLKITNIYYNAELWYIMAAFLNVDICKIIKIFNIQQLYNNCGVKWFLCYYMASICLSQYINKELFPVISSIENLWYYLHTRYKKAGKDISSLGKIYDPDIGQHYVCKLTSVLVPLCAKLKVLCLQHM